MPEVKVLDIRIFGVREVQHELFKGMMATGHMDVPLNQVADNMMEVIDTTFTAEGRRGGGSWQALKPMTQYMREKEGYPPKHPILQMTGALRRSMTVRDDENQDLNVTRATVRLSSKIEYAEAHQTGNSHVPARPFVKFLSSDVERWAGICERYLYNSMSRLR